MWFNTYFIRLILATGWRIDCRVLNWIQKGDYDNNTNGKSLWAGLREVAMELVKRNGYSFRVGPAGNCWWIRWRAWEKESFCRFSESWIRYVGNSITRGTNTFAKDQCSCCGFQFVLTCFSSSLWASFSSPAADLASLPDSDQPLAVKASRDLFTSSKSCVRSIPIIKSLFCITQSDCFPD